MLRSNFKYYLLLLIFSLFFSFPSFSKEILIADSIDPYCDGKDIAQISDSKKIKSIEIITNKRKKVD